MLHMQIESLSGIAALPSGVVDTSAQPSEHYHNVFAKAADKSDADAFGYRCVCTFVCVGWGWGVILTATRLLLPSMGERVIV
jgi:hypothetical protein